MKIIAYLFYIGEQYSVYQCNNFDSHNEYGELCPHGLIDKTDLT